MTDPNSSSSEQPAVPTQLPAELISADPGLVGDVVERKDYLPNYEFRSDDVAIWECYE
jgi:hypothetical protein